MGITFCEGILGTAAALWHLRSFRDGVHAACAGGCLSEPLQRRVWQEPVQKGRMHAIESAVCQRAAAVPANNEKVRIGKCSGSAGTHKFKKAA